MIEVRQTAEYASWFASLRERSATTRIDIRVRRLCSGNAGDAEPVGEGVHTRDAALQPADPGAPRPVCSAPAALHLAWQATRLGAVPRPHSPSAPSAIASMTRAAAS